jgi:hypothetical protein
MQTLLNKPALACFTPSKLQKISMFMVQTSQMHLMNHALRSKASSSGLTAPSMSGGRFTILGAVCIKHFGKKTCKN